ncbi:hypothetical protein U27_00170 [Candidatus Vecturithrix granuli]|uniref:Lysozyme n=1 Tax=Vecturithrix granuli TaxID=1499967 RepID=A0A081C6S4_VECG1|nr:hypothetical protein U27_00170 [Candidatus Vecturithrix granuli]
MNLSEQGRTLLIEWEGCECRVYLDIAGKQAIGIGHLLTKDELSSGKIYIQGKAVRYADGLTEHQVLNLLDQDLKEVERTLNKSIKVTLAQHQFDALASFALNVGSHAFKKSTLLKVLNIGQYEDVPGQMRRWVYSGGQRARGLCERREKECALWHGIIESRIVSREISAIARGQAVQYGQRIMQKGMQGADVQELQIRLAGFSGTVADGDFGSGTETQVKQFQRDVMQMKDPTGIADQDTLKSIEDFGKRYPIDFEVLKCPCGKCSGFGQGKFKGQYRDGKRTERNNLYEYPGIHRMLLWAVRAVMFYHPDYTFPISSGYRCSVYAEQKGMNTTNHQGKAVDLDPKPVKDDKLKDEDRCEKIRQKIIETAKAVLDWSTPNRKSLESAKAGATTWVHYDVRNYDPKYLEDRFFCTTAQDL